jgi:hypothetical protein
MVKKMLVAVVIISGVLAMPSPATAAADRCVTTFGRCMEAAAKVDSFWYRWAAGLDCELDFTECVRIKLIGV